MNRVSMLRRLSNLFFSRQFLRFLLVGGVSALVNFGSGHLLRTFLQVVPSVWIAYVIGTISSFFLNKFYTFRVHDEHMALQGGKFVVVGLTSSLIGSGVAWVAMQLLHLLWPAVLDEGSVGSIAHVAAIGVTTVYNFLAMKFFSFRRWRRP